MAYLHAAELQGDMSPTNEWLWGDYIRRAGLRPAPIHAFNQPRRLPKNTFCVGHLIRAQDSQSYNHCLARVEEVSGYFVRYVFLAKEDSDSFWIVCDDYRLKPLSEANPHLKYDTRGCIAPTGVDVARYMPTCEKIIKEGANYVAPNTCFTKRDRRCMPTKNEFEVGHMLLAYDEHQETNKCLYPAMVTKVDKEYVWLTFPGWGTGADIKLSFRSRCLFPFELASEMKMLSYQPVELPIFGEKPHVNENKLVEVKQEVEDDGYEAAPRTNSLPKKTTPKSMQKEIGIVEAANAPSTSSKASVKTWKSKASTSASSSTKTRTATEKRLTSRQKNAALKEQELGVTSKVESLLKQAVDERSQQLASGLPAKRNYTVRSRVGIAPTLSSTVTSPPIARIPVNAAPHNVRPQPPSCPPPPAANFESRIVRAPNPQQSNRMMEAVSSKPMPQRSRVPMSGPPRLPVSNNVPRTDRPRLLPRPGPSIPAGTVSSLSASQTVRSSMKAARPTYRVVPSSPNMPRLERAQPSSSGTQTAARVQYSATITTQPLDARPQQPRVVASQPTPANTRVVTTPTAALEPVAVARTNDTELPKRVIGKQPAQNKSTPVRQKVPCPARVPAAAPALVPTVIAVPAAVQVSAPPVPTRRVIRIPASNLDTNNGVAQNIIIINGDNEPVEYAPVTYIMLAEEAPIPGAAELRIRPVLGNILTETATSSNRNVQFSDTTPEVIHLESSPEPEEIVGDPRYGLPEKLAVGEDPVFEIVEENDDIQPVVLPTCHIAANVLHTAKEQQKTAPASCVIVLPKPRRLKSSQNTVNQNTGYRNLRQQLQTTGRMSGVPPTVAVPPSHRLSPSKKPVQTSRISQPIRQSPRIFPAAKANCQSTPAEPANSAQFAPQQEKEAAKHAARENFEQSLKRRSRVVHVIPDNWDTTSSDDTLEMEPLRKKTKQAEPHKKQNPERFQGVRPEEFISENNWDLKVNTQCYPGPYLDARRLRRMQQQFLNRQYSEATCLAIQLIVNCAKFPEKVLGLLKTVPASTEKRFLITTGSTLFECHIPVMNSPVESYLYLKEFLFRLNACPKIVTVAPYKCNNACHDPTVRTALEYEHRTCANGDINLDQTEGDLLENYGRVPTVKEISRKFLAVHRMFEQFILNNNIGFEYLHMLDDQTFAEILPKMSAHTLRQMATKGLQIREEAFRRLPAVYDVVPLIPPYSRIFKQNPVRYLNSDA